MPKHYNVLYSFILQNRKYNLTFWNSKNIINWLQKWKCLIFFTKISIQLDIHNWFSNNFSKETTVLGCRLGDRGNMFRFWNKRILFNGIIMLIFPWNEKVKRLKNGFIENLPITIIWSESGKKKVGYILIILFSIAINLSYDFFEL